MSDVNAYGLAYHNIAWGIIGIALLVAAGALIAYILFTTRKKPIKRAANLITYQAKTVNLNSLKEKYIGLVNKSEQGFNNGKIKASACHQQISMIVRLFFYEALGLHAEVMTLNDLKKTKFTKLAQLIDEYYPNEFDMLESGPVKEAAEKARKIMEEQ